MQSRLAVALFALLFLVSTVTSSRLARLDTIADRVEGEYIVVFRSGLDDASYKAAVDSLLLDPIGIARPEENEVIKTWEIGAFRAAHVRLNAAGLLKVRSNPTVEYVSENGHVYKTQSTLEPPCTQQNDVIWNLDRVNTHDIDLVDDNYRYGYAGEDVDVYVIDTGVLITHVEFAGSSGQRAIWGANFVNDGIDNDCNGHGTHVAGSIGGILYGVAKKSTIIAVKVLSCGGSGTFAGVISGVEWTAKNAASRGRPSVANMSLGGGKSAAVNDAVAAAVKSGVTFAVAAGNSNADACMFSPASEPLAITIAATTIVEEPDGSQKDQRASFSNIGSCVDIAAPGQLIKAAWIDQSGVPPNTAYNIISGTSMASPHVAAVAAIVLSENPKFTPAEVEAALLADTTNGAIDMACGSSATCELTPNKLLYTHCE